MSDTNLGVVGAGSPDKYLDGEQVTVGGTAVFRSRTRVGGSGAAELAAVKNTTPGTADYGLVTRGAPDSSGVDSYPGGNVAHDAADSGNPLKVGGKARAAFPTAVTAADRVDAFFDLYGRLVTSPLANPESVVTGASAALTGTASGTVVVAPSGGTTTKITEVTLVTNGTVATIVELLDGATVKHYAAVTATPGQGQVISFGNLPLPISAGSAFMARCQTAPGGSVYVSAVGHRALSI
jgi:hypothetical protein